MGPACQTQSDREKEGGSERGLSCVTTEQIQLPARCRPSSPSAGAEDRSHVLPLVVTLVLSSQPAAALRPQIPSSNRPSPIITLALQLPPPVTLALQLRSPSPCSSCRSRRPRQAPCLYLCFLLWPVASLSVFCRPQLPLCFLSLCTCKLLCPLPI